MTADILTKPLGKNKFNTFLKRLNLTTLETSNIQLRVKSPFTSRTASPSLQGVRVGELKSKTTAASCSHCQATAGYAKLHMPISSPAYDISHYMQYGYDTSRYIDSSSIHDTSRYSDSGPIHDTSRYSDSGTMHGMYQTLLR